MQHVHPLQLASQQIARPSLCCTHDGACGLSHAPPARLGLGSALSSSARWGSLCPAPVAGKLAGLDKKLSRSLEADVAEGSSPQEMGKSPMGPLSEASRYAPHPVTAQ